MTEDGLSKSWDARMAWPRWAVDAAFVEWGSVILGDVTQRAAIDCPVLDWFPVCTDIGMSARIVA